MPSKRKKHSWLSPIAWWQQHEGYGGFTGTVCECADARAYERHQRADVRAFVLGRGRRDDNANDIVIVGSNAGAHGDVHRGRRCAAAPANDTHRDADTDTWFVKLNLIYYHYLFICHNIDRHAAANVALPPPPQPPRCCHRAAAVALFAAAALHAAAIAADAAAVGGGIGGGDGMAILPCAESILDSCSIKCESSCPEGDMT